MTVRGLSIITPAELIRIATELGTIDDEDNLIPLTIRALTDAAATITELTAQRDHWKSAGAPPPPATEHRRQLLFLRREAHIAVEMARVCVQHLDAALEVIRKGETKLGLALVGNKDDRTDD